jgi:DNA end-binding protein Ku
MPRPVWNGTISFGLVSIPIKLFHAVSKKNVSFNQLDERDMSRIRYKKVSASTEEEVPDEHIVKGYEVSKGNYVVVDPDELEPFLPTATRAIELEEFVDLHEIDPVFFDAPYHVAPDKQAKPYVLLTRAMEEAGKVAIGRFVMRNKQYVAALRPVDGRLMMSTMIFADGWSTRPTSTSSTSWRTSTCPRARSRWPSSSSTRWPLPSSRRSTATPTGSRSST